MDLKLHRINTPMITNFGFETPFVRFKPPLLIVFIDGDKTPSQKEKFKNIKLQIRSNQHSNH